MDNPVDRRTATQHNLDAFWDEIVAGRSYGTLDLPPDDAKTILHLHARDITRAPNPSFVHRLREELMTQALVTTPAIAIGDSFGPRSIGETKRSRRGSNNVVPDRQFRWLAIGELAAVAALIIAIFGSTIQGNWFGAFWQGDSGTAGVSDTVAMYRGSAARTGVIPGPALQGEPGLLWRHEYGNFGWNLYGAPTVADGVIYALAQQDQGPAGTLIAFEAATGQVKWFAPVGAVEMAYPTIANGVVYLATAGPQRGGSGTDPGYLLALDADDGTELWRFYTGGVVGSSPAVVDDTLYLRTFDGTLYAIDTENGSERWRFAVDPSGAPTDRPAINEGSYHIPSPVSPAVVDGTVYAASNTNKLFAIDAKTGQEQWSFTSDGSVLQTPAVVDGAVYVAAANGFGSEAPDAAGWVYALDASSGKQRWSWTTTSNLASPPAVSNGLVYIGRNSEETGGELVALAAETGIPAWTYAAPDGISSDPTVVGTTLYVRTSDARLNALDTLTGTVNWSLDLGVNGTEPAFSDGIIVVGSYEGTLFGIGSVDAQAGSPAATPAANGDVSGLPVCEASPRGEDTLRPEGTPAASLVPVRDNQDTGQPAQVLLEEIPEGTPASDDQVGGIYQTIQQMAACSRPGYKAELLSFYSDDYFRRAWVRAQVENGGDGVEVLVTYEGKSFEPSPIATFDEAQVLPDGRLGVLVMTDDEHGTGYYLVFVPEDGRWLIDERLDVYPELWTRG